MRYIAFFLLPLLLFASKPELLLLKKYEEGMSVKGWLMSEKLDGVRAYWDGKELISRGGKVFKAPKWFIKDFPPFAIDGELWSKRADFANILSITSKQKAHKAWSQITYNIFEVPYQSGGVLQRLEVLKDYLKEHKGTTIRVIKQFTCKGNEHLKSFLKKIESQSGEGVVIRNPKATYIAKRTSEVLKVKSFEDAECEIVGYKEGKGKYETNVGSFVCKIENKVFHVGSGLSDVQRQNPPKIGSIITYKYQGLTKNALPRFPVFLKIKKEVK